MDYHLHFGVNLLRNKDTSSGCAQQLANDKIKKNGVGLSPTEGPGEGRYKGRGRYVWP